jgi:hypothetical protein
VAIKRTHRIAVYLPPEPSDDPYESQEPEWRFIRTGIPANLQSLGGNVEQTAAGRQVKATARGFVPPEEGRYIVPDARIKVLEGPMDQRTFRVTSVAQQGGRWDTEFLMTATAEVIP